jgi:hypothetical protein
MVSVDSASTNIHISNNIYWNGGDSMYFNESGTTHQSVANFTLESSSYKLVPQLIDPNNLDFTPLADSVAINNGTSINGKNSDPNPDIGAIQHIHKVAPNAPKLYVLD